MLQTPQLPHNWHQYIEIVTSTS